jgi:copper(I)-binding protein
MTKIANYIAKATLLAGAFIIASTAYALELNEGWVQSTPGGVTAAAYGTLYNDSENTVIIQSITSASAGVVEIHDMVEENGTMRMVPMKEVEIAAKGNLPLAPGAKHIMLMRLTQPLQKDQTVALKIHEKSGKETIVELPVRPIGAEMAAPCH